MDESIIGDSYRVKTGSAISRLTNVKDTRYFRFKLEDSNTTYTIPQTVVDGSDSIQVQTSWDKKNLPGSTEPMVAYNFTDAPVMGLNIKYHEDMFREAGLATGDYLNVTYQFLALAYPSASGQIIKPPYCYIYIDCAVYRGFFTNLRVTMSGVIRNGYKTQCEVGGSFTIIRKYAPIQTNLATKGFRTYFSNETV